MVNRVIFSILGLGFVFCAQAVAHQPIIMDKQQIAVPDPEISKGYYAKLSGIPHIYTIESATPFELYVGILVPNTNAPKKDVKAEIRRDSELIATIGGQADKWKVFFEPFGQSTYWDGGDYKAHMDAGNYQIVVSSLKNDSKYVLSVGEREYFGIREILSALRVVPDLKLNFFEESPISLVMSPFGWGFILALYVLAFVFGFSYRFLLKTFAKNTVRGVNKNIGWKDRLFRLVLAAGLLLWAITTSWNPFLIFLSGFALFESTFSWCGFYAALGRNTCQI